MELGASWANPSRYDIAGRRLGRCGGRAGEVAEDPGPGEVDSRLATDCQAAVDQVQRVGPAPLCIQDRRLIIKAHRLEPSSAKASGQTIDAALENFERLTGATAQRVVRFWQVRQGTGE